MELGILKAQHDQLDRSDCHVFPLVFVPKSRKLSVIASVPPHLIRRG
jgi:hypothetical protein